ncbi:hypothetical protein KP509_39G060600 [Ceratopteris richardii]|uniref:Transmembrane 9 superfamily member n=1 Tax=Ceratopteris richardii TaxID=49495 RepID=A0A8T2Q208_CERRI|nr:hypothetical protein KP509_39G060600 [Ceratopteris richardii]KAH7277642.1 hypothetical protein KP509_39G060600 [Ceratopteris richardii]KAH7277643.1 hypothetical protein KP509_39G060600 [Ceratopteris richardii]
MGSQRVSTYWARAAFILLISLCGKLDVDAFYLPGSYMKKFTVSDVLTVMVNSLTSIETELPFGYYTLPYCLPQEGEKHVPENLGELLMGDRIENSPYRFHMNVNESSIFLCTTPKLSAATVKMLKQRISDIYQVNIMLDNLPAIRYVKAGDYILSLTGFPVGYSEEGGLKQHIIYNHLKFTVLVHEYDDTGSVSVMSTGDGIDAVATGGGSGFQVVGFEVTPCSLRHTRDSVLNMQMYGKISPPVDCDEGPQQPVQEGEQITFSYDVTFIKSDIRWPSRWDAYLKMEGARVHWFSILNSLMVIAFLAGIVFVIFLRTVRRDLTKYEELDKEEQAQMTEELSGWKLVVGDVFRAPAQVELLSVMVGDGVQIAGMAVVTIFFAALGFMSPASRGMLLSGMIILYLVLGILSGYIAVRLWRTLKANGDPTGWRSITWRVACFFPGIAFGILPVLNFLLWASKSTGALPISLFFVLLALWFCISVPLTLLGGYFGARAEHIQYPVRTNQIPREIPQRKYPSWLLVLGAGTLPFGTLFIELFFIMSSIWLGRVYYVFGFLLVVLVLLVIVCAEVSVVLTYMHLCVEDWKWWWKSFFASGSVGLYVFIYAVNYLVFDLRSLSGPVSTALYMGYTVLMVLAIILATGTIGFLSSFWFVYYLFSSVKID